MQLTKIDVNDRKNIEIVKYSTSHILGLSTKKSKRKRLSSRFEKKKECGVTRPLTRSTIKISPTKKG